MYSRIRTEELKIKDVFNIGFALCRQNIKFILILGALVLIPMYILTALFPLDEILSYSFEELLDIENLNPGAVYLAFALIMAQSCLFYPMIAGGATGLVRCAAEKGNKIFDTMIAASFGRIIRHVVTAVFYYMFLGAALSVVALLTQLIGAFGFLIIFPFITVFINYMFYTYAVAATGKWGYSAFIISAAVVRVRWYKTVGFMVLTQMFIFMVNMLIENLFMLLPVSFAYSSVAYIAFFFITEFIKIYFYVVIAMWFMNKYYLLQNASRQTIDRQI